MGCRCCCLRWRSEIVDLEALVDHASERDVRGRAAMARRAQHAAQPSAPPLPPQVIVSGHISPAPPAADARESEGTRRRRQMLTTEGIFPRQAQYENIAFMRVTEGTLVSESGQEYYMTSQYEGLGRTPLEVYDALLLECAADSRCIGFHMHPVELRGALLYDSANYGSNTAFPPPMPASFRTRGARQNWSEDSPPGWRASGLPSRQGSVYYDKGWDGWHAYAKTFLPAYGPGYNLRTASAPSAAQSQRTRVGEAPLTPTELRAARLARFDTTPPRTAPPQRSLTPPPQVTYESSPECVICLDAPADAVLAPCGHQCGCYSCLDSIRLQQPSPQCPICRCSIYTVMRADEC